MPLCAKSCTFAVEKETKSIYQLLKITIMKTKKSNRVFKTTSVNDEIFAFISASARVLTMCQDFSDEAIYLANNLWHLYHQLGGHDRSRSLVFEHKLRTSILG